MAAYNFAFNGTPDQISQAFNNYINGFIGIQPDQGVLQDVGTLIGHQMNANPGLSQHLPTQQAALTIRGETDPNTLYISIRMFNTNKSNTFPTGPLNP